MLPHPLTNFKIQKYFQNKSRFNAVYSRDNLPNKIKDGTYVLNLYEYFDIGTHWVALYTLNNVTYFDRFGIEHVPKEIKKISGNKNIRTDIFGMCRYDWVMCRYFCVGFNRLY